MVPGEKTIQHDNLLTASQNRALDKAVSGVLAVQFLKNLCGGELKGRQVALFLHQYFHYCAFFPRALALTAYRCADDAARAPFVQNLWEEHGSGRTPKNHRELYWKLVHRINAINGKPPDYIQRPKPYTSIWIRHLEASLLRGSVPRVLGVMGPGTEMFTSAQYQIVLDGLKRSSFFRESDLEFFRVHISMDVGHAALTATAAQRACRSPRDRSSYLAGALAAIKAERQFWRSLNSDVLSSEGT